MAKHHQQIKIAAVFVKGVVFNIPVLHPTAFGIASKKYQHFHLGNTRNQLGKLNQLLLFVCGYIFYCPVQLYDLKFSWKDKHYYKIALLAILQHELQVRASGSFNLIRNYKYNQSAFFLRYYQSRLFLYG